MSKEPWINSDIFAGEPLTGNREGLEKLKCAIDQALNDSCTVECHYSCTENVIINLENKECYNEKLNLDERSKLQKVRDDLIVFLFCAWFIILPFVAVGLITYEVYFESELECHCLIPVQPKQVVKLPWH
ncbi:hypothetical protein J8M21_22270 [Pseudoalteromonas luteoviolacea]|uniref:hypothetical protein n=1 Tax=Pseudoalteromonas luteoviolacea TaxID=43657 RepID=UPI001B3A6B7F|nr:hypothetical protein [Pseudoalteromonas luteoviolacea]MBQ4879941.1 hypothetical protein [Pseudoalteromonas luteoviolacea]MBQ4908958.1 hypothetical protein [Pseudoalteromonas luteoviolacea]